MSQTARQPPLQTIGEEYRSTVPYSCTRLQVPQAVSLAGDWYGILTPLHCIVNYQTIFVDFIECFPITNMAIKKLFSRNIEV